MRMSECNKRAIFRLASDCRETGRRKRRLRKPRKVESIQDIVRDYSFQPAFISCSRNVPSVVPRRLKRLKRLNYPLRIVPRAHHISSLLVKSVFNSAHNIFRLCLCNIREVSSIRRESYCTINRESHGLSL